MGNIGQWAKALSLIHIFVMVTHNMQQAVRVSDTTVFFLLGEIVESGATGQMFSMPKDKRDVYKRQN